MLYRPEWSWLKRLLFVHATAVKTGFEYYSNIEKGTISGSTGLDEVALNRARTIDYIPINKFVSLEIPSNTQYSYFAFLYKSDKTSFVRIPSAWSNNTLLQESLLTDYQDYEYIRVIFRANDSNTQVTSEDLERIKTIITVKKG